MTVNDAVVEAKDAAAIARSNATDGMVDTGAAAANDGTANATAAAPRKTSRKNSATEALARLGGKKF